MATSIAIAGKGGTGKTTITALIIRHLLNKKAGPILAIDADPDANLAKVLGIQPEKSMGDLREEILRTIRDIPAGMTKAAYMEAGLHQIVAESDGLDLITMGRGEGAGCYCYLNSLIRKFSDTLTSSYRWVVMDNEAGLEHISRRTTSNIDVLLAVVTESPLSIDTAKNIQSIVATLKNGIRRSCLVTSMVRPERLELVKQRLSALTSDYIGDVPRDTEIEDAIVAGRGFLTMNESAASESIAAIMTHVGG